MNLKPISIYFFGALMTMAATTAVHANPVIRDGIVTDPAGRTLYVFDKDEAFKSHCEGGCLQAWPAYTNDIQSGASVPDAATRFEQDQRQQWAWQGKPLYYFAGDTKPGERTGDGSGGVWHMVRPVQKAAAPASYY
jgi:predicted lipoprotein with Yx(FWY)xxD motif